MSTSLMRLPRQTIQVTLWELQYWKHVQLLVSKALHSVVHRKFKYSNGAIILLAPWSHGRISTHRYTCAVYFHLLVQMQASKQVVEVLYFHCTTILQK